ncbi:sensor histidine kinase [Labedella endophytica]|uniref:histidine kinase n=1 Tax=Labedella endophytica TaxID=1523160 RepID=A0A3S0X8N5_9MICO|nr:sensor histidine kinase [Labedella endophytica]RUQ98305.1 sensor histidine kinase [Labedella endophytica]
MSTGSVATPVFTELHARRRGPLRRLLVRRPGIIDAVIVACFAGWSLLMGVGADSMYSLNAYLGGEQVLRMQYAALGLAVAGSIALLLRRRYPVPVAAAMAALGVVALGATGALSGFELGLAFALYVVADSRRSLVAWVTCVAAVAVLLVSARLFPIVHTVGALSLGLAPADESDVLFQASVWYQTAVPVLVLALVSVAVGTGVRNNRLHVERFVDAANAVAREHEQRTRLAEAAERARIAREMHDVVAHSIAVMVALGGGASVALEWAPDRARTALDELVTTGRSALVDMRRVLGVLHSDGSELGTAEGAEEDMRADTAPLPSADGLPTLVDRFRLAGTPVRTTNLSDARLRSADVSLQLAVYRVVQESLTNVLRHAPGTRGVDLVVDSRPGEVEIVVTDRGATMPVDATGGSGRGLIGMRERVTVFGGRVDAGPHGDGWRVRATFPLAGEETE